MNDINKIFSICVMVITTIIIGVMLYLNSEIDNQSYYWLSNDHQSNIKSKHTKGISLLAEFYEDSVITEWELMKFDKQQDAYEEVTKKAELKATLPLKRK